MTKLLLLAIALFASCSGRGPGGSAGLPGKDGIDGEAGPAGVDAYSKLLVCKLVWPLASSGVAKGFDITYTSMTIPSGDSFVMLSRTYYNGDFRHTQGSSALWAAGSEESITGPVEDGAFAVSVEGFKATFKKKYNGEEKEVACVQN